MKPTYRKSWAGNLLVMSDLNLRLLSRSHGVFVSSHYEIKNTEKRRKNGNKKIQTILSACDNVYCIFSV